MKWINIFFLFLVLLPPLWSQALAENQADPLERSLSLISDTLTLIETIETGNEQLKAELTNASALLKEQGRLLNEQATTQAEQSAISGRQATLLKRELRRGKALKVSFLVSVPVCLGLGIWAGRLMK